MMLKAWDSSGNPLLDIDTIPTAGACLGTFDVPAGSALSQEFPGYTGASVIAVTPFGSPTWNTTVDNALGYPRVTAPAVGVNYQISIWAMTKPNLSYSGTGVVVTKPDQSTLVFSPGGIGLYYAGSASVVSSVANSGLLTSSGSMGYHTLEFSSSVPIVPVLEVLPGYHTHLISVTRMSSTLWRFTARRSVQSTPDSTGFETLATPRILCYARRITPSGPPYAALWRDNGELAWDLMQASSTMLGALAAPTADSSSTSQSITVGYASETWGIVGNPGGLRRTGSVTGATWRMRELQRMFNRTVDGTLVINEVANFSYLADSNESGSLRFASPLFVTRHTGI